MKKVYSFLILGLLLISCYSFAECDKSSNENNEHFSQNSTCQKKNYIRKAVQSILDRIKSDLGFEKPLINNPDMEQIVKKSAISLGFFEGCRLYAYTMILRIFLDALFVRPFCDLKSLPPQFDLKKLGITPKQFVAYAVIVAPLVEESFYTYGASTCLGPTKGTIYVPLLFGLNHYHDNKTRYLIQIIFMGLISWMHTRNHHANLSKGKLSLAPVWSHVINNIVGSYFLFAVTKN